MRPCDRVGQGSAGNARTTLRRARAIAVAVLGFAITAAPTASAQGSGTLQGQVIAIQTGVALAYAVVSVPQLAVERFTDPDGRFTLTTLPAGKFEVLVKRIGYSPYRAQVEIAATGITRLDVRLTQLPVRIAGMTVRALANCPHPGVPTEAAEPEVFTLISLLRENADRYRLLSSQYPFVYLQVRAVGALRDTTLFVQRVDTVLVKSATRVTYRAGRVVERTRSPRGGAEYTMAIPTILDLADEEFSRNHCFSFGGTSVHAGETWLRLEVRAADRIKGPDVHGNFYLDSATSQLRRMDLTLSRPERLPRELRAVSGVDAMTSFLDIAAGLSVIDRVCGLNHIRAGTARSVKVTPAELQQLLQYEFTEPPPGVRAAAGRAAPEDWRAGAKLTKEVVWCAN